MRSRQVESEAMLWEMQGVRLAESGSVILEHRCMVHGHCLKLTTMQAEGSLYRAWTATPGRGQFRGAREKRDA